MVCRWARDQFGGPGTGAGKLAADSAQDPGQPAAARSTCGAGSSGYVQRRFGTETRVSGTPAVAYLAAGKLYLKRDGEPPRLIESPFVQGILDRVSVARQRHEWKSQGMAWQFTSRAASPFGAREPAAESRRVRFSGVSAGEGGRDLLYTLDTDYVGGLFSFDLNSNLERRIFHRNQFRAADVQRHPTDNAMVFTMNAADGTSNIAVLEPGGGIKEMTEGDSLDEAPSWAHGGSKAIVFQSAGVGRNPAGAPIALAPYAIQKLGLDRGDLTTLMEDEQTDYLVPRLGPDGTLYFIRRPYEPRGEAVSPWRLAKDILFFPFRLAGAVVHFLNFFSMMFARKPLLTAGGPPKEGPDARFLMLWGRVIDTQKALAKNEKGAAGGLVPKTWELIERPSDGSATILARGVVNFDLCPEGGVVFTNGSTLFHLPRGGEPRELGAGSMIERVVVIQ